MRALHSKAAGNILVLPAFLLSITGFIASLWATALLPSQSMCCGGWPQVYDPDKVGHTDWVGVGHKTQSEPMRVHLKTYWSHSLNTPS